MSEASGIPEINFTLNASDVIQQPTDATLTAQGMPADAKAVGERLAEVNETIADLGTDISDLGDTLDNAVLITEQSLEPEEQAQARENIGLGSAAVKGVANNVTTAAAGTDVLDAYQGKVLKDSIDALSGTVGNAVMVTEQTLTAEQKTQARENIGAPGTSDAVMVTAQTFTAAQQAQARANIGAGDTARVTVVNISNLAGLPQTITAAQVTADMVVVHSVLSMPAAQLCDWTVTAANGSLVIAKAGTGSGIGYGGTDLTLYLEKTGSSTAQVSLLKQAITAPTSGYYYTRGFAQSDEESIFTSIARVGSIRVHRSGSFLSVRLLDFVPDVELTAGTTYTIATLPENCRIMLMMQGNFISSNGQYRGILAVQAGAGTVAITPTGSNIPAGTSLIVYMPIYNMARDHDDQDLTGYVLTTPTGS